MNASLPKGTRDFLPSEVQRREYIFSIIRSVFTKYGFVPIETPAFENLSTLTGKYGDEGDQLLFKILNNGDFLAKADREALRDMDSKKVSSSLAKRGLKYDLTVPFARYVVMHKNDLYFPFKRYQIQPVWRADRPQKGRYQEFYQCDADIVGSDSLLYEAEFIYIYDEVFRSLGLDVEIKMNNRKVLWGITEALGVSSSFVDVTMAIDKLDKIGRQGVLQEFENRCIASDIGLQILDILEYTEIDEIAEAIKSSPTGVEGVQEIKTVFDYLDQSLLTNELKLDMSLARGLSYYTGCIFEVSSKQVSIGSIGGGGRYADLTKNFGDKSNLSGVGISFGAERIYDVLNELDLFPRNIGQKLKIQFVTFDQPALKKAFEYVTMLRKKRISCDLYPEPAKMKKQMKYANDRDVPFVGIIGETELTQNKIMLKDMNSGNQQLVSFVELLDKIK